MGNYLFWLGYVWIERVTLEIWLSASKQRSIKLIDTKSSKSCVVLSQNHYTGIIHKVRTPGATDLQNTFFSMDLKVKKTASDKVKNNSILPHHFSQEECGESKRKAGTGHKGGRSGGGGGGREIEREWEEEGRRGWLGGGGGARIEKGADAMRWRRKRKRGEGRERTLETSKGGERKEDERTITTMCSFHVIMCLTQWALLSFSFPVLEAIQHTATGMDLNVLTFFLIRRHEPELLVDTTNGDSTQSF